MGARRAGIEQEVVVRPVPNCSAPNSCEKTLLAVWARSHLRPEVSRRVEFTGRYAATSRCGSLRRLRQSDTTAILARRFVSSRAPYSLQSRRLMRVHASVQVRTQQ